MGFNRLTAGRGRTDLLGRSVLLIEDDFCQARDTEQALQHAGARVIGPYSNADAALEAIAKSKPSCAIVDIGLQEKRVFSTATALMRLDIPFVFVTALEPSAIPDELRHMPRLCKPADYRALLRLTAELSAGRWR